MFVVVSYDIVCDRRRYRVAKCMEDFGMRVQKSVFDCILDEKAYQKMKRKLAKLIDFEEDSIRFYRLCTRCSRDIELLGTGTVMEEEDMVMV